MIRAIIATINGDATTLEQSTDKDLIAKVIRQGGRRVWVDSADADGSERAWIAQTFDVPLAFLALDWTFFENEPALLICLRSPTGKPDLPDTRWLPIIIVAKPDLLLTAHATNLTLLDRVFSQAAQTSSDWKESTAPLLWNVVETVVEPTTILHAEMLRRNHELTAQPPTLEMLEALYKLRVQAFSLRDKIADHRRLLYELQDYPPIGEHKSLKWLLEQRLESLSTRHELTPMRVDSWSDRAALLASQQNAALIEQSRQLYSLLRVALPTIILLLIVLILVVLVRG